MNLCWKELQKNQSTVKGGKYLPAICDTADIAFLRKENSITNYTSMPQNTPVAPSHLSFHSSRQIFVIFLQNNRTHEWRNNAEKDWLSTLLPLSFPSRPYLSNAVLAPESLGLNKQLNATHRNRKCQGNMPKDKRPSEWRKFCVYFSMDRQCCHLKSCQECNSV